MTDIITPAAIKAAAKRIRDLESDRLGQKLPNTTLLNALTQGFGLGQTFAAFASAAAKTAPEAEIVAPTPVADDTCTCVAYGHIIMRVSDFENQPDGPLFNIEQQKGMRIALPEGWRIDIGWAANGLQKVTISKYRSDFSYADALAEVISTTEYLRFFIETQLPEVVREDPIIDHFAGVNLLDQDDPKLRISYHIKDGYSAEAEVSRTLWEAAMERKVSETEALIVLHETDEIEAQVTPEDIVIDEIMQEKAPYAARKTGGAAAPEAPLYHRVYLLYEIDQSQFGSGEFAFTKEEQEAIYEDAPAEWKLDIRYAAHGYQVITFEVADDGSYPQTAESDTALAIGTIRHLVSHHAPGFLENAKSVNDGVIVPIPADDVTLEAYFEYVHGNDICTAEVLRSEWRAFYGVLPKDDALLLLARYYEFDESCTAKDIITREVLGPPNSRVG